MHWGKSMADTTKDHFQCRACNAPVEGMRSCGCVTYTCGSTATCTDYHHGDGTFLADCQEAAERLAELAPEMAEAIQKAVAAEQHNLAAGRKTPALRCIEDVADKLRQIRASE